MKVKGIAWLGSPTERFDEMMRFATDVLGLKARHRAPVAGFRVDDVVAMREEMERKGVLFIGPVHHTERGGGWSHFFGPDGHVYEITSRG